MPHDHVADEADEQPGRPRVPRAGVRDQREHPDHEGERGADERRHRDADAPDRHLRPRPEGTREVRLGLAQADHGELRSREGEEDAERIGAREEGRVVAREDAGQHDDRGREQPDRADRLARDEGAALEPPELARQHPVLRHRAREPGAAADRRRGGGKQDEGAGEADEDAAGRPRRHRAGGRRTRSTIPTIGACSHSSARSVEPSSAGKAQTPTIGDQHRHDHDEADGGEERSRQRLAGLARLLREVRHRLETGVGEHREREREEEVVPALARREVEAARQHLRREDEREPEHDDEQLHGEVEEREHERGAVDAGVAGEPHAR